MAWISSSENLPLISSCRIVISPPRAWYYNWGIIVELCTSPTGYECSSRGWCTIPPLLVRCREPMASEREATGPGWSQLMESVRRNPLTPPHGGSTLRNQFRYSPHEAVIALPVQPQ